MATLNRGRTEASIMSTNSNERSRLRIRNKIIMTKRSKRSTEAKSSKQNRFHATQHSSNSKPANSGRLKVRIVRNLFFTVFHHPDQLFVGMPCFTAQADAVHPELRAGVATNRAGVGGGGGV